MKTKEFIRKVEQMDYEMAKEWDWISIYSGELLVAMTNEKGGLLKLSTMDKELMRLCLEYAETPIEEREEEKLYTVVLPDPEQISHYSRGLCKVNTDKVMISFADESIIKKEASYRLTESEIKRNHEYLWQFAKEVE